jgi:hypothetical protein
LLILLQATLLYKNSSSLSSSFSHCQTRASKVLVT